MGLLDKLTEGMRSALERGAPQAPSNAPLSDRVGLRNWTDENLRGELERRDGVLRKIRRSPAVPEHQRPPSRSQERRAHTGIPGRSPPTSSSPSCAS